MIAFELKCGNDHRFEGWFENADSFEDQKSKGMISCPHCENLTITKLMSTFTMKRVGSPKLNAKSIASKLRNYVENSFDNVGTDFANEALKMHYGVVEHRNIRGVSSPEEENVMKAEGINFFKLPLFHKLNDKNQDS